MNSDEYFGKAPPAVRKKLLELRALILETARKTPGVGAIEEAMKWKEPSFLTAETKSGSTVRIAWKEKPSLHIGIYFNCKTDLIETFRSLYPNDFTFEGRRAIIFSPEEEIPVEKLSHCIAIAQSYHLK